MFVKVVFNLPIDNILIYKKPDEIKDSLVGCRVIAPVKSRNIKGIVIEETEKVDGNFKIQPIKARIDIEPICSNREFELAKWMSKYYHSSFGESLFASLPAGNPAKIEKKSISYTRKTNALFKIKRRARKSFKKNNRKRRIKKTKNIFIAWSDGKRKNRNLFAGN